MSYEVCVKIKEPLKDIYDHFSLIPKNMEETFAAYIEAKTKFMSGLRNDILNNSWQDNVAAAKKIILLNFYIQQLHYPSDDENNWIYYLIITHDAVRGMQDFQERYEQSMNDYFTANDHYQTYKRLRNIPSNEKDKLWEKDHYVSYTDSEPCFENIRTITDCIDTALELMSEACYDAARYMLGIKYYSTLEQG